MSDIQQQIKARLDGYDHSDWCNGLSPCDCRPGASAVELADAIRDVLSLCEDLPESVSFIAESFRLSIASRLRIVDASEVNRQLLAAAIRRGVAP